MFQVYCLIENFFWLVLRVLLDLWLVVVQNNLRVSQVLAEDYLEFVSRDQDRAVYILLLLVLLLVGTNSVSEKKRDKKNLVSPPSSSVGKVVFI